RYGDCKGSAYLLVEMLKAVGIDARLTWIGTSSIPEDWDKRPAFSTGNHMIASVMLPDTILYIDGTTGPVDFGYIPSGIQGKQALIDGVGGGKCTLSRVPVQNPAVNTDSIVSDLNLVGSDLSGKMSDYLSGIYKYSMIDVMRSVDSKTRDKAMISKLALGRKNVRLSNISTDNLVADGGVGHIAADIVIPAVVTTAGDKVYLSMKGLMPNFNTYLIEQKDRHHPATLSTRKNIISCNTIRLSEDLVLESLPESAVIDNKWISGRIDYNVVDDEISVKVTFMIKNPKIAFEDIAAYNSELTSFIIAISRTLTLLQR
ncbi:MAG: transglutaminase domain-containing protein, partial [Muribaculaceae bacterium]|nr:transglutaminase domain-containing protein [Muribaculaceae bacterium]